MTKTLVVLSDIQVGHTLSVMPEVWTLKEGRTVIASKFQRALFKEWERLADDWHAPDILVLNGEPIEGQQPRNMGVEVWTTDLREQLDAARSLVEMWYAKKIYLTRGTDYHVTLEGNPLEEVFAEMVDAAKWGNTELRAPPEGYLKARDGSREWWFHFAHHVQGSRSGWQYRTTPIAKEMMLMKLNEARKHYPADIIIRSHIHYHCGAFFRSHLGMTTPCWQLPTWYAYKKGVGDLVPEIGGIRFHIDGSRSEDFRFPDFEVRIVNLPDIKPPLASL